MVGGGADGGPFLFPFLPVRPTAGNVLRAAESGFSLLRCSSNGFSVAVGPYLDVYGSQVTLGDGFASFTMPRPRSVPTFYSYGGYIFPYACVALTLAIYAQLLATHLIPPAASEQPEARHLLLGSPEPGA